LYFRENGLCLGLANCVCITFAHAFGVLVYLNLNSDKHSYYNSPFIEHHPKLSIELMGLIIGVISGCVMGLFALLAKRMIEKKV